MFVLPRSSCTVEERESKCEQQANRLLPQQEQLQVEEGRIRSTDMAV